MFEIYVKWLYSGKILTNVQLLPGWSVNRIWIPIKFYLLGERLLDRNFQDLVVNVLVCMCRDYPHDEKGHFTLWHPDVVSEGILYQGTPASSLARRLLVHYMVDIGGPGFIKKYDATDQYQAEFVVTWPRNSPKI